MWDNQRVNIITLLHYHRSYSYARVKRLGKREREKELACVLTVSGGRESSVQPQSHFTDPHTPWKIVLSHTAGFGLSLSNTPIDSLCEWIKNMSLCRDDYPPRPIAHAVMMTANVLSNFCSCWAKRISIGQTLWLGRHGPSIDPSSLSHPLQRNWSSVLLKSPFWWIHSLRSFMQ